MTDAATFPVSDDALARTIVFDHPMEFHTTQVLVSIYADGSVEVAQRAAEGQTWGPPWTEREAEVW